MYIYMCIYMYICIYMYMYIYIYISIWRSMGYTHLAPRLRHYLSEASHELRGRLGMLGSRFTSGWSDHRMARDVPKEHLGD